MGSTRSSFTVDHEAIAISFVWHQPRSIGAVARNMYAREMTLVNERKGKETARAPYGPLTEFDRGELIRLRQDYKNVRAENTEANTGGIRT